MVDFNGRLAGRCLGFAMHHIEGVSLVWANAGCDGECFSVFMNEPKTRR
jgi:hypothetical protein